MLKIIMQVIVFVVVGGVIASVGYVVLNIRDGRTTSEKIGDSIDALSDGVDEAERQMKSRTPGEKLNDAVKDVRDDIREKTNP
jgi:gas vesicle protein